LIFVKRLSDVFEDEIKKACARALLSGGCYHPSISPLDENPADPEGQSAETRCLKYE
jgi:hypothetical protein